MFVYFPSDQLDYELMNSQKDVLGIGLIFTALVANGDQTVPLLFIFTTVEQAKTVLKGTNGWSRYG